MDLSALSDADLLALNAGDLSKVSDAGLKMLNGSTHSTSPWDQNTVIPQNQELYGNDLPQPSTGTMANIGLGALKGATDLGATALYPLDKLGITGTTPDARRAKLGQIFQSYGQPDSLAFRGGELASDIAGTAGAGGLVGGAVKGAAETLPFLSKALMPLGNAIESGGFTLGQDAAPTLLGRAAQMGTRLAGGAINGGATAGMVNPNDAGFGATVGAALPGGSSLLGGVANTVKSIAKPFYNPEGAAADAIANLAGPTVNWRPQAGPLQATADQLTDNPGIAAAAKGFFNTPEGKVAQTGLQTQNNQTAWNILNGLGGSDAAVQAAKDARAANAENFWKGQSDISVPVDGLLDYVGKLQNSAIGMNPGVRGALGDIGKSLQQSAYQDLDKNIASNALQPVTGLLQNPGRMSSADFDSLTEAKRILGSARIGKTDIVDVPGLLSNLPVTSQKAQNVIQQAIQAASDQTRYVNADVLDQLRQNTNKYLQQYAPNGIVGSQESVALDPLRQKITDTLGSVVPNYQDYLAQYGKDSVPINTMQVARNLQDKLGKSSAGLDLLPNITPAGYRNALAQQLKAQRFGIDPGAKQTLLDLAQSYKQQQAGAAAIKSTGSDTILNRNIAGRSLFGGDFSGNPAMMTSVGALAGAHLGGPFGAFLGSGAGRFVGGLLGKVGANVSDAGTNLLMNPDQLQALLAARQPRNYGLLAPVGRAALINATSP